MQLILPRQPEKFETFREFGTLNYVQKVKDHFSAVSQGYKKYRPEYPKELYDEILKLVKSRNACWDCATGNAQAALQLSKYFDYVYATDISENQITKAEQKDNIIYSVQRAEKTDFGDDQFDLITVAQGIPSKMDGIRELFDKLEY